MFSYDIHGIYDRLEFLFFQNCFHLDTQAVYETLTNYHMTGKFIWILFITGKKN